VARPLEMRMAEILTLEQFRLTEPGPTVEMSPIRRDVLEERIVSYAATIKALHEALLVSSYPVKEEDVRRSYGTIQKLRTGGWIR